MAGNGRNTLATISFAATTFALLYGPIATASAQNTSPVPTPPTTPTSSAAENNPSKGISRTADSDHLAFVKRCLETEVDVQFQHTPVKKILEFLNDVAGVDVQIVNVDVSPWSTSLHGRFTIERILDHLGKSSLYDWAVTADKIVIVPESGDADYLFSELYEVESLITDPHYGIVLSSDFDRLEKAVRLNVDPESWNPDFGPATITTLNLACKPHLLIRQSARNHIKVDRLLNQLHDARKNVVDAERTGVVPARAQKAPPAVKPDTTGTRHGHMLTGLMEGEEARVRVQWSGCFGVSLEYDLHFQGEGRAAVAIYEIVDPKKPPQSLGTIKLSRDDRIGLNNWLSFARGPHDERCSSYESYEIRWIVDGEPVGTETMAYSNCSDERRQVVSPWSLVTRLRRNQVRQDAPILAK